LVLPCDAVLCDAEAERVDKFAGEAIAGYKAERLKVL